MVFFDWVGLSVSCFSEGWPIEAAILVKKIDARRNNRILSASSSDICVYFDVSLRTMACQQLLHGNVTW